MACEILPAVRFIRPEQFLHHLRETYAAVAIAWHTPTPELTLVFEALPNLLLRVRLAVLLSDSIKHDLLNGLGAVDYAHYKPFLPRTK